MFKLKSAWNIAVGDEIRIPGGKTIMKISRIEYEGDRVFHIFAEDGREIYIQAGSHIYIRKKGEDKWQRSSFQLQGMYS